MMKKKWLLILFLFTLYPIPYTLYPNFAFAQETPTVSQVRQASPTPVLESEKERLQKALRRMTPESLQNTGRKSFVCKIEDFLGLFGCDSEKYQNLMMPEAISVSSEGNVQGAAESAVLGEKTTGGEVKGINVPIVGSILNFINSVLGDKDKGGAFYFPRADSLGDLSNAQNETRRNKEIFDVTEKTLLPNLLGNGEVPYIPPAENIPGVIPTLPPLQEPQTETARSVRQLAKVAGDWAGVPWQIVEAMLIVEGSYYHQGVDLNNINSGIFSLSPEELIQYQQPNARYEFPDGRCAPNACSAAGVMQMTTTGCVPFDTCEVKRNDTTNVNCNSCKPACDYKPSAWSAYKGAVIEAENDGRTPNICNIKDSVFAGAKKMKADSGTAFGVLADWDYTTVTRVTNSYYGSCIRCGAATSNPGARYACERLGKTYCDFVWDYYQANKNLSLETSVSSQAPIEGFDDNAQVIVDNLLVDGIRNSCVYEKTTGRVSKGNVDCLENINPAIENGAKAVLRNSAIAFGNLQCVGFSIASERLVSGGFLETADSIGAAIDYARNVPYGFTYINKINPTQALKAGDHLLWNVGASGHIAYVERVYGTNIVQVAEANWSGPGVVRMRNVTLDASGVIGWLSRL